MMLIGYKNSISCLNRASLVIFCEISVSQVIVLTNKISIFTPNLCITSLVNYQGEHMNILKGVFFRRVLRDGKKPKNLDL